MNREAHDNFIKTAIVMVIMIAVIAMTLSSCGGAGGSGGGAAGNAAAAADKNEGEPGDYKIPKFRDAKYNKGSAQGNGEAMVDTSSVENGYIGVLVNSDAKVKLQIIKGKETYTYDVVQGKPQIFPLQCGDGGYTIKVMKNVEGNTYFELYTCQADVKLKDKFQPYTRPNQYADYNKKSECVKVAAEFAKKATCESDFVSKVYEYVCSNVKYDYDLAESVESGYIPEPDKILSSGKGICFDYASLAASMLRSQGIPTKIIFGYVEPNDLYHAWNMFYTKETGWVTVSFETGSKEWNRLDLTFSANGENDKFIGDGTNYQDVYQY